MRMLIREEKMEIDIFSSFGNRKRSSLVAAFHVAAHSITTTATSATLQDYLSLCRCHLPLRALLGSLIIGGSPCYSAGHRYERTRVP